MRTPAEKETEHIEKERRPFPLSEIVDKGSLALPCTVDLSDFPVLCFRGDVGALFFGEPLKHQRRIRTDDTAVVIDAHVVSCEVIS